MKRFFAYGHGTINFQFPVEANSQDQAEEMAQDYLDRHGLGGVDINGEYDIVVDDVTLDEEDIEC